MLHESACPLMGSVLASGTHFWALLQLLPGLRASLSPLTAAWLILLIFTAWWRCLFHHEACPDSADAEWLPCQLSLCTPTVSSLGAGLPLPALGLLSRGLAEGSTRAPRSCAKRAARLSNESVTQLPALPE